MLPSRLGALGFDAIAPARRNPRSKGDHLIARDQHKAILDSEAPRRRTIASLTKPKKNASRSAELEGDH
jgi:hypothetical protein